MNKLLILFSLLFLIGCENRNQARRWALDYCNCKKELLVEISYFGSAGTLFKCTNDTFYNSYNYGDEFYCKGTNK